MASAIFSACVSLSITQGPAMRKSDGPPIVRESNVNVSGVGIWQKAYMICGGEASAGTFSGPLTHPPTYNHGDEPASTSRGQPILRSIQRAAGSAEPLSRHSGGRRLC